METSINQKLTFSSRELESLFGSTRITTSSENSFTQSLLNAIDFKSLVDEIKSLSRNLELKKTFPDAANNAESGTIFVFEVDVRCEKDDLKVTEKNSLNRARFFGLDSKKTTCVIWVNSRAIRVIDAKLQVFKDYEEFLSMNNVLIHHAFEECDEICKLSGVQKLQSLHDLVTVLQESIPDDACLEGILRNAANETFSWENIKRLCYGVNIKHDGRYIGIAGSREYTCYFFITVKEIKKTLVKATVDEVIECLGSKICQGILEHIKSKVKISIEQSFHHVRFDVSDEIFATLKTAIIAIVITYFIPLLGLLYALVGFVTTFIWSVNVNSEEWRSKVADEIFKDISKRRKAVLDTISPLVKDTCRQTKADLGNIARQVFVWKEEIPVTDQQSQIKEWKKREVIKNRETLKYPVILTYIAGKRNNTSVVKVFLRHEDAAAKDFFQKNSDIPNVEFVPVSLIFGSVFKHDGRGERSEKHVREVSVHEEKEKQTFRTITMEQQTRDKLNNIIKTKGERLISSHSNIISLGVGRELLEDNTFGKPCIVIHCLDKTLLPFGEQSLPRNIEGFPVDLREDFVLFGSCLNCSSLKTGCGIGIPSHKAAGSVGFLVKPKHPSSANETGFLTAAHVAVEHFQDLYFRNTLLSEDPLGEETHAIVHPPWIENQTNNVIGNVVESFCGNYGTQKIGMDAAFVKVDDPKVGVGLIEARIANERYLHFDGSMHVEKEGRTTQKTEGVLLDNNLSVCVDLPSPKGGFYFFEECYEIGNINVNHPFFLEGDSGSGVFLIDSADGNRLKPLGIAFARSQTQTVACKIRNIIDAFNLAVYIKDES